jgi:hypothetical protein
MGAETSWFAMAASISCCSFRYTGGSEMIARIVARRPGEIVSEPATLRVVRPFNDS